LGALLNLKASPSFGFRDALRRNFNPKCGEVGLTSEQRHPDLCHQAAPTVLVVEDEVLIRMALAALLRDEGFTVIEACNADEALVALSATSIDLLLTDVRMDGSMDGLDLAAKVRSTMPDLKIVVVSGHLAPDETHGVADAFVPKPYLAEKVVEQVKTILSGTNFDHAF
jgi:DNA-binding NtrC family response regulator